MGQMQGLVSAERDGYFGKTSKCGRRISMIAEHRRTNRQSTKESELFGFVRQELLVLVGYHTPGSAIESSFPQAQN